MRFRLLLAALTLGALAASWHMLGMYENTPGQAAFPPTRYPEANSLPRLLLFLHPRCPCSEATVEELRSLRPQLPGLQLEIVLTGPVELTPPDLIDKLRRDFADAQLTSDLGGLRRQRFHVWTSGQVVTYDRQGLLGYCGGITPSRGQLGDSAGKEHLLAWFHGQPAAPGPVFGCPLVHPDEICGRH